METSHRNYPPVNYHSCLQWMGAPEWVDVWILLNGKCGFPASQVSLLEGKWINNLVYFGCGPLTVTVTTKIITFLIGNPNLNLHLPLLLWGHIQGIFNFYEGASRSRSPSGVTPLAVAGLMVKNHGDRFRVVGPLPNGLSFWLINGGW